MPKTPPNIPDYTYTVEVEADELLARLRRLVNQQSHNASSFYRALLDQILNGLEAGDIEPDNIVQYVRQQLQRSIVDDTLEHAIFSGLENDLNDIARVIEKGFKFLDPDFRVNDLRVIARKKIGAYALDNGVKIGERMAVDIQNVARFYTGKELEELTELYIGNATTRLKTVVNDILMGYDREMMFLGAVKSGLTHFRYRKVINPNTRFFCYQLVKLPWCYTKEQINEMDNGQKLDVETYAGGYRCVHGWTAGKVGWPGFEKPFPKEGKMVSKVAPNQKKPVIVPQA